MDSIWSFSVLTLEIFSFSFQQYNGFTVLTDMYFALLQCILNRAFLKVLPDMFP